jgi:hypothetical protein
VSLSKDIARRAEQKEKKRIIELAKEFDAGKTIDSFQVFDSEIIPHILEEKPLLMLENFRNTDPSLPTNFIFYSKILVPICPDCYCNSNPELIRPYLERNLILPILADHLTTYRTDFLDLAFQYPYIGTHTFRFVRYLRCASKDSEGLCPRCFNKVRNGILKKLQVLNVGEQKRGLLKRYLEEFVFPSLFPADAIETNILGQVAEVIGQKNFGLLRLLSNQAYTLYNLRNAQIFEAIPQVAQHDLSNISASLRQMNVSAGSEVADNIDEKKWVAHSLNIDYTPDVPVEDYLDVILPRRKKINNLVNELISSKDKSQHLPMIQDALWKINEELSVSKTIESLTFATRFVSDNSGILFGMLMGGLIGYYSGSFAGCGLGSIGGLASSVAGKVVLKRNAFKLPRYPKKTLEWIKEKCEGSEEKALSKILSKDIKTIQVWALKERLKKP